MAPRVLVTKDEVNAVVGAINKLVSKEILVGIPEAQASRDDEPVTNAALGYIHEFGAPGANIPARPWLIPGVRKGSDEYMPHLRGAAGGALDGRPDVVDKELGSAGLLAAQSAKREMAMGDFVPLKPATIAARRRSRGTASRRKSEEQYLELVRNGMSPADAQAATGIRPLINTRQMFNAVTSVVRKAK